MMSDNVPPALGDVHWGESLAWSDLASIEVIAERLSVNEIEAT